MKNKQELLNDLFQAMEARVTAKAAYEEASLRADVAWEKYMACLKEEVK